MYLLCMVVAMWREGNMTSIKCIGTHGGGHVLEIGSDSVGREKKNCVVVILFVLVNMYMYM